MTIKAEGQYPIKRNTLVQDVAYYQNDGTKYITASKFVERAERKARHWLAPLNTAATRYMQDAEYSLRDLGLEIAYDINVMCDRIKTGRLKKSMRPIIEDK